MLKNRIAVNILITMLIVGIIAGISITSFHSSANNGTSQFVNAATSVPVPGASVSASGTSGNIGSGSAIANAQGQYTVTSFLDTGTYSVTASAPGFIDQQVDNVAVTAGAQTSNVNIVMNVSGGISGKVTDAVSGLPVYLAFVNVESSDGIKQRISRDRYERQLSNYSKPSNRNLQCDCRIHFWYNRILV